MTAPRHRAALAGLLLLAACSDEAPANGNSDGGPSGVDAGASLADGAVSGVDGGRFSADGSVGGDAGPDIRDDCDPVAQSGCAPPTTKCVVEGPSPGTACVEPVPDEGQLGDTCAGRDCAPGLACVRLSATATASECVKVCDLDSGAGCALLGDDWECRTRLTGTNWGACRELPPVCDPYACADPPPATGCACQGGEACQPFLRREGSWEFRCRTAGNGAEGAACGPGSGVVCQRGLACVSTPQGNAFCRRICETTGDCENMAQCIGSVSEPPFMYCQR